jgi:hypothetical protein
MAYLVHYGLFYLSVVFASGWKRPSQKG